MNGSELNTESENCMKLYRVGSIAAFLIAILMFGEILVYALIPNSDDPLEIFKLFNNSNLSGLLFFDLLGMISYILFIPFILSLYMILKKSDRAILLPGTILFFIGIAIFFANNTGFSVLRLSNQYDLATTNEEKAMCIAACKTMITLFDVNAFLVSYVLVSVAWTMISYVMLNSKIFIRKAAYAGLFAGLSGVIAEIIENTLNQFLVIAISFYFLAIVFLIIWVTLSGRQLYQMGFKYKNGIN
ncbi:MAG TPA: DUF4386 family protein [Bacteroidales bacterium]|nr:DUF4386 family protein [Bacteroidales bacterium]